MLALYNGEVTEGKSCALSFCDFPPGVVRVPIAVNLMLSVAVNPVVSAMNRVGDVHQDGPLEASEARAGRAHDVNKSVDPDQHLLGYRPDIRLVATHSGWVLDVPLRHDRLDQRPDQLMGHDDNALVPVDVRK